MRKLFLWLIVLVVVALAAMPAVAYAAHSGSPPGEIGYIVATAMVELNGGFTTATQPDVDCGRRRTLAVLAIAALMTIAGTVLTRTSRTTRTHLRDGGWSFSSA